jgi:beta-galactosidase
MISFRGQSYPWHIWGTVTHPAPGTESWGYYEDQFFKGRAAILHRKAMKGSVTYAGAWSDNWELEYALLRELYGRVLGSLPFDLPPYVFAHFRQGLWSAVNYTDKTIAIPVPRNARILTGETKLPPAGVLVWKEF